MLGAEADCQEHTAMSREKLRMKDRPVGPGGQVGAGREGCGRDQPRAD